MDRRTLLIKQYGDRMTLAELARELRRSAKGIANDISAGRFPITTYKLSGRRFVDTDDFIRWVERTKRQAEKGR